MMSRGRVAALVGTPVVLAVSILAIRSCGGPRGARSPDRIRDSGKIVFITRNSPTTYYEDRSGSMAGMEYDMAVAFAAWLGVVPEFRAIDTVPGILDAVTRGEGDIAAAGLTRTPERAGGFLTGPSYQSVKQLVVCRRGGRQPKTVAALADVELRVMAASSYEERLLELKESVPGLDWEADENLDTEQLLELVWREELDCTISDDNIFDISRRYYPELVASLAISDPQPLTWFFNPESDALRDEVAAWFEEFRQKGGLSRLKDKYYGFVQIFDYVDTRKYVGRIETVLPRYRPLFEDAARKYGLGWTRLAAQSYQESHWDPRATSPTGVKGIMMLTIASARELGVTNRLDPEQCIDGGARYLRQLIDRLPPEIEEPDRTWIALAAYNVGMAHLYDARGLARRLGKNPDRWKDLAEVLPLLAQHKYYTTLEHGYARGSEPVHFVNRIRYYRDVLDRHVERNVAEQRQESR